MTATAIQQDTFLCTCGVLLAKSITDVGIIDVTGEDVPFRRNTDFLLCPSCHNVYSVTVARSGVIEANRLPVIDLVRGNMQLSDGTDVSLNGVELSNFAD